MRLADLDKVRAQAHKVILVVGKIELRLRVIGEGPFDAVVRDGQFGCFVPFATPGQTVQSPIKNPSCEQGSLHGIGRSSRVDQFVHGIDQMREMSEGGAFLQFKPCGNGFLPTLNLHCR